jgi:hypothetical protein
VGDLVQTIQQGLRDFSGGLNNDPSVYPQGQPDPGFTKDRPTSVMGGLGQSVGDFGRGMLQEGVLGLLDPQGMMDRQAVERELRGQFAVVPNGFVGPRLPNQVTEAEYEQLTHTYSDIRLGRSDIHFDGTTDAAYREGTMHDIASIMQTGSGRSLITSLANNTAGERDAAGNPVHHGTTLRPMLNADGTLNTTNASTQPVDAAGAGVLGTPNQHVITDGTGSRADVAYNPGVNVSAPGSTQPWNGSRSDIVLMHELVHAFDSTHGMADLNPVVAADGVPSDVGAFGEEHQAIGIGRHAGRFLSERTYRDERRAIGLGHTGVLPGDATLPQRGQASP